MDNRDALVSFLSVGNRLKTAFWTLRAPRISGVEETLDYFLAGEALPEKTFPAGFESWLALLEKLDERRLYIGIQNMGDECFKCRVLPLLTPAKGFFFMDDDFFLRQSRLNPEYIEKENEKLTKAMAKIPELSFIVNCPHEFVSSNNLLATSFRDYAKAGRGLVFSYEKPSALPVSCRTAPGFGSSWSLGATFEKPADSEDIFRHVYRFHSSEGYMAVMSNAITRIINESKLVA